MSDRPPLVSIGIPTYNRAGSLHRTVRSALAQDHPELEVVVSDDGSTDGTPGLLQTLEAGNPRLRCVKQPVNLGHARNFQAVLEAARGEYFMWLSDDDWLDESYVSQCLAAVRKDGHILVCGLARYHARGRHAVDERPTDLLSGRPGTRLLGYFARVNVNGALFGLARRADLAEIGFVDEVGGDWRLVGALASRGRIRTLRDVHIHRSLEGLSTDAERLARSFGMNGLSARHHHVIVATRLAKEVAIGSPAFAPLSRLQRAAIAPLVALLLIVRFPGLTLARRVLQRLGLHQVEPLVTAWVRKRD